MKKPRIVSKVQAADFFGVSRASIDGWIRRGCPVLHRPEVTGNREAWQLDLLAVCEWRFTAHQPPAGADVEPDSMAPADRLSWYAGEARRLAIEETQSNLIPRADVERTVAAAFEVIAQTVQAMPGKVESQGIKPAVAGHVEAMLELELEALAGRLAVLVDVRHEP